MSYHHTHMQGFALLLALIVSSVVLAIGISILQVSVNQINLSATARESEIAFQAAHAGLDCQWYWRLEKKDDYANGINPIINCFGIEPAGSGVRVPRGTGGGDYYRYVNEFDWGDPGRCTETTLHILKANDRDEFVVNGLGDGIGINGNKTCPAGNICTVVVSTGYNRACDEIDASIYSVQRELTLEF
jgi:hypothetical protein